MSDSNWLILQNLSQSWCAPPASVMLIHDFFRTTNWIMNRNKQKDFVYCWETILCKKLLHSCWEGFDKLINLSFHLLISTAQIISPYMPDYCLLQHQQRHSHKLSQPLNPVTLFSKDKRQEMWRGVLWRLKGISHKKDV